LNKDQIVERIQGYEEKHGESFVDHLGYIFPAQILMSWALGKGYLKPEQFEKWVIDFRKNELEAEDMNYFLYDDEYEDEDGVHYALIRSSTFIEEKQQEAFNILAEFIFETKVYLKEFLEETK